MKLKCCVVPIVILWLLCSSIAGNQEDQGNLKYTFGKDEEIPAGFFDSPESEHRRQERGFPACRDGSGGMCIEAGQCSPDKRAERIGNTQPCGAGLECCYGAPLNTKTPCRDNGGDCTEASKCGRAPQVSAPHECPNNQVCCIWT